MELTQTASLPTLIRMNYFPIHEGMVSIEKRLHVSHRPNSLFGTLDATEMGPWNEMLASAIGVAKVPKSTNVSSSTSLKQGSVVSVRGLSPRTTQSHTMVVLSNSDYIAEVTHDLRRGVLVARLENEVSIPRKRHKGATYRFLTIEGGPYGSFDGQRMLNLTTLQSVPQWAIEGQIDTLTDNDLDRAKVAAAKTLGLGEPWLDDGS